jgi:hypothetical protein
LNPAPAIGHDKEARMRRPAPLAACLLAALAAAPLVPARADSVTEQIDQGRAYYEEGDYAGAIAELEFALNEIRAKVARLYSDTLPAAPAGWRTDEADVQAGGMMFGGGTSVSREYREDGGRGYVQAQLMIDNPMLQGLAALFSNPALLAAQSNVERVRVGRDSAMLKWDEADESGEITLLLGGGRGMVQLEGRNLPDKQFLVDLLNAWDLRTVKDIAGL